MSAQDDRLIQYQPPIANNESYPPNQLHTIVPPLHTEQGVHLASTEQATRTDVINLEQRLATQLRQRQARASGLCPIRFELSHQCFHELIRQAYVNQPETGLLMARLRDEMQRTVAIYQSLYMDSLQQLKAEDEENTRILNEKRQNIVKLETENEEMKRELAEVQAKLNVAEKQEVDRRAILEKKHAEEQVFLRKQQIQLQSQWDNRQQQ
ncbi:Axonemal_dynein light chain [Hexamita inflata]|uniref:Axonemal dynein light chain n=1 Tax=Hexamita inflata TaxID=28002 RepID=A0AA86PZJ1_9EUKA|nr:Axonemal dynein light chain [Hexamita inflata]